MRRSFAVVALWTLLLAACGGGDSDSAKDGGASDKKAATPGTQHDHEHGDEHGAEGAPADADCSPSGTELSIVAEDTKFDKSCLAAPANKPFKLSYDNRDGIAHNIVFLESHEATEVMFRADIFTGPKTSTFNVDAVSAGTYAFHCEVHPSVMAGTLVVK